MKEIRIVDAPDIPGLSFRNYQGEADLAAMVEVFEASREVDRFDWVDTLEDTIRQFDHLDNCDPDQDMLVAEVDGKMIAHSRAWWEELSDGETIYVYIGLLMPEWRRRGIGRAMIRWTEGRLREIAAGHKGEKKYFQRATVDSEVGLEILLQQEGYQAARYGFRMTRPTSAPLPDAPMPAGLEVRPATREQTRQIITAADEAFLDHWGARSMTENNFQEMMASPTFKPELWKVAWDGDEVAGNVLNYVDEEENQQYGRKRAYTEGISVRRPWRRRGLARALLVQSIQMFKELGFEETVLGVDSQNLSGALRLYEGVGYQVERRSTVYRKELSG
jgi:mycothiol synthase